MAKAEFTIDALVYSDVKASNDPQQRDFDYTKTIGVSSLSSMQSQILQLPATTVTTLSLPAASINWLYIETDQLIYVRFNGDVTDKNEVSPSTPTLSDGVLFKRGAVTSLVINVPGASIANVRLFAGI